MDFDIMTLMFVLSLKLQVEKRYDEEECNEHIAYLFENIEELKMYLIDNGLNYMNSELYLDTILESCIFKKGKSGKVLALKRMCDGTITNSRRK